MLPELQWDFNPSAPRQDVELKPVSNRKEGLMCRSLGLNCIGLEWEVLGGKNQIQNVSKASKDQESQQGAGPPSKHS